MVLLPAPAQTDEPSEQPHVHRWRIDEQSGARSPGRCDCGTERDFRNGWEGDSDLRLRPGSWLTRRTRDAEGER